MSKINIQDIDEETLEEIVEAAINLAQWGDAIDDPDDLPAIMKDVAGVIRAAYVIAHS